MKEIIERLRGPETARAALSELKKECRTPEGRRALLRTLGGDLGVLTDCLQAEDPKTRKNAAGVLGLLHRQETLGALWEAYQKEGTLFVRSAYPEAMLGLSITEILPELRDLREELAAAEPAEEEKKHRTAELAALTALIGESERGKKHAFAGKDLPARVVLLTNRNHKELVLSQLEEKGITARTFSAGVIAEPEKLSDLWQVRTFSEALFPVPGTASVAEETAARELAAGKLRELLGEHLSGEPPYGIRVDVRSREEPERRAAFAKKTAKELSILTAGDLLNSPSDYEAEIRLIANSAGTYNVLVKFMNLPDRRFSYRKQSTASSMQPSLAALLVALARDVMREGARVLDPMCGTGTLLIERQLAVPADTLYGLDIHGVSLTAAQVNTGAAGMFAHYVRRDFGDFTHEYPFDEVITDFPRARGSVSEAEIDALYRKFFRRVPKLLRSGGVLILYTHDLPLVRRYGAESCRILRIHEISRQEGSHLAILTVK